MKAAAAAVELLTPNQTRLTTNKPAAAARVLAKTGDFCCYSAFDVPI